MKIEIRAEILGHCNTRCAFLQFHCPVNILRIASIYTLSGGPLLRADFMYCLLLQYLLSVRPSYFESQTIEAFMVEYGDNVICMISV